MLKDTVYQTSNFVNDKFTMMFEQLVSLEEDSASQNLMINQYADPNKSEKYNNIIEMNRRLNDIYLGYYQMLDSIYFYSKGGTEIKLFRDAVPMQIGLNLDQWDDIYNNSDKGYYWLNNHIDEVFRTVEQRQVMSVFKIYGNKDAALNYILLFNLKNQYFSTILQNVKISSNGYMVLISPDGMISSKEVLPAYDIAKPGLDYLREKQEDEGSFNIRSIKGEKMLVVYNTIKINNWRIAAIVPEKEILESASQIKYISLLIIIILIFVSTIVAAIFAGSISGPIRFLSKRVREFEKGNFNVKFDVKDSNELNILANGLSSLVKTVENLLQKVKDEQEKKRKVELLALQSQINPHFLYNTLASIKHLIDMNENERASKMVGALTKFFMIGISKGKEIITLREEIEHVQNYLSIQKMRYSKDFEFSFQIDENILDCRIIKLTLQPIVENAIYHGIKNKQEMGMIKLNGYQEETDIVIEVWDDGAGISTERLQGLIKSINLSEIEENPTTFGLRNVNQRIKLHFGEPYGLSIESTENIYTKVTIRIPFRQ